MPCSTYSIIIGSFLRSCLEAEPGLKHVPVLDAQVGQQEGVEGVRVEVRPVAVFFPRVEVIRPPEDHAVLARAKQKNTHNNVRRIRPCRRACAMLGVTGRTQNETSSWIGVVVCGCCCSAAVGGAWMHQPASTVVCQAAAKNAGLFVFFSREMVVPSICHVSSRATSRGATAATSSVRRHTSIAPFSVCLLYHDIVDVRIYIHRTHQIKVTRWAKPESHLGHTGEEEQN